MRGLPVEILSRDSESITFACYNPLEGLEPLKVEEVSQDWTNWKHSFGPVEVEDLVILPPWKKVIFIKPGSAFGTGLHPSTKLALRLMVETLKEGESLLDVGTGSGILAIAGKVLGAGRVVGIDVDPKAVEEAKENAKANGVFVEFCVGEAKEVKDSFDVVVANLETEIFKRVLADILEKAERVCLLSGIYGEGELKEIEAMISSFNLSADRILTEENWYALRVVK